MSAFLNQTCCSYCHVAHYFKSLKEYKKFAENGNVEVGRPDRYPVVMSFEAFEGAVWNVQVKVNLNNSRSQYAEALIGLRGMRSSQKSPAAEEFLNVANPLGELTETMNAVETGCLRGFGVAAAGLGGGLPDTPCKTSLTS